MIKDNKNATIAQLIDTLESADKEQLLNIFIENFKDSISKVSELSEKQENVFPLSILDNKKLSALETIVKYLKEEQNLSFHNIAVLLNRNDRTIWTTYSNAIKKLKEKLPGKPSKYSIPIDILKNRSFSILELLVQFLKDNYHLSYSEIARLINRDQRNVWTVYNRAKKKNAK